MLENFKDLILSNIDVGSQYISHESLNIFCFQQSVLFLSCLELLVATIVICYWELILFHTTRSCVCSY